MSSCAQIFFNNNVKLSQVEPGSLSQGGFSISYTAGLLCFWEGGGMSKPVCVCLCCCVLFCFYFLNTL